MNEDPTDKLIRELQEENERLKAMLEGGGVVVPKGSGEDGIEENDDMTEAGQCSVKSDKAVDAQVCTPSVRLKWSHKKGGLL